MYLWYEYETERQWQREIIEKIRRSVNFDQRDIFFFIDRHPIMHYAIQIHHTRRL